jgi:hypothetical protein
MSKKVSEKKSIKKATKTKSLKGGGGPSFKELIARATETPAERKERLKKEATDGQCGTV